MIGWRRRSRRAVRIEATVREIDDLRFAPLLTKIEINLITSSWKGQQNSRVTAKIKRPSCQRKLSKGLFAQRDCSLKTARFCASRPGLLEPTLMRRWSVPLIFAYTKSRLSHDAVLKSHALCPFEHPCTLIVSCISARIVRDQMRELFVLHLRNREKTSQKHFWKARIFTYCHRLELKCILLRVICINELTWGTDRQICPEGDCFSITRLSQMILNWPLETDLSILLTHLFDIKFNTPHLTTVLTSFQYIIA